jgi:BMFP domain-containing protein YqiC
MTLTLEDIEALRAVVVPAIERKIDEVDARHTLRFDRIEDGLLRIAQRVTRLEERVEKIEQRLGSVDDRLGRLARDIRVGRTSDRERLAALEARVAEIEGPPHGQAVEMSAPTPRTAPRAAAQPCARAADCAPASCPTSTCG